MTILAKAEPLPLEPEMALAPTAVPEMNLSIMFERLAANPDVNVEKLQALMEMQRTILQDRAKVLCNAAMTAAQQEMRPISADAENPQTRSRYASYNALDRALRPIYTRHGFGLSFNTADGAPVDHVRVVCLVSHAGGFERDYHVDMPNDGKGAKGGDVMTKTHATGAAMSYGMRYLLKMIFNVAVGEDDKDGNAPAPAPDGYEAWLDTLQDKATEGTAALQATWQTACRDAQLKPFAKHLTQTNPRLWEQLKASASKVQA